MPHVVMFQKHGRHRKMCELGNFVQDVWNVKGVFNHIYHKMASDGKPEKKTSKIIIWYLNKLLNIHLQKLISDPYRTFFLIFDKMAAGGHFGCPQITFDRISSHFRSIRNFFFLIFFDKMAATVLIHSRLYPCFMGC